MFDFDITHTRTYYKQLVYIRHLLVIIREWVGIMSPKRLVESGLEDFGSFFLSLYNGIIRDRGRDGIALVEAVEAVEQSSEP